MIHLQGRLLALLKSLANLVLVLDLVMDALDDLLEVVHSVLVLQNEARYLVPPLLQLLL